MTLFSRKMFLFCAILLLPVLSATATLADTLAAQSAATAAAGVSTTNNSVFQNVVTTPSVTLNAAGKVLVVATFSMNSTIVQIPKFRLSDGTTTTTANFGRYTQGSNDHGLAQLVYLFTYGASGTPTFSLQHKVEAGKNATLTTTGTIVAIPLVTATSSYTMTSNSATQNTEQTTTSTAFSAVTGTTISSLALGATGDFYVSASLNSTSAAGNTTGVWRLEYKSSAGSTWTPVGLEISRTMSGTSQLGAVCLNGVVKGLSSGNYDFRVAHKSSNGTQIGTNYVNIVAVALANSNVSFDTFQEFDTGVTTTSSSETAAVTKSAITPANNTNIFLHAVYEGITTANLSNPPAEYDLYVDNAILDGVNQKRSYSSGSYGSGASTGLASSLTASTTYNASLRHKSDGTVSLATSGYLLGIDLNSANTFSQYPCTTEPPQSPGETPGSDNALFFDSTSSSYVNVADDASLDLSDTWTIEMWVRPGSLTGTQGLIAKGSTNNYPVGIFLNGNTIRVYYGTASQYTSTATLTTCSFYHVAVTFDNGGSDPGTLTLYINGIQDGTASVNAPPTNNDALTIGRGLQDVAGTPTNYSLTGTLDEVRVWKDVALTQTTIRDWMCSKVTSDHPNWSGLSGYWRFDEDSGTSCTDSSSNTNTGTTTNMTDAYNRVCSFAPVGDESAHDYAGTATAADYSATLIYTPEGDSMTVTGDGGTWNASTSGIHLYRVDEAPNKTAPPLAWGNGYALDPLRYWGVFVTGGTSPTYTAAYTYSGHQGIDDESTLKLAYRNANCDIIWKALGATLNTTTDTLTKTGLAGTEFILGGAQSGPDPLVIDLLSFTASRSDTGNSILVEWETATEVLNAGFYLYRAETKEGSYIKLTDTLIPGRGSDTQGAYYLYEDVDVDATTGYWYKLEDIDTYGVISTVHGPVLTDGIDDGDSCFISTMR